MMTSTPVTQQQQTDGRTVREVVEFNQELVNEVWCRRIFRQILQSLELQYAMQMPHRPINPDTVLVLDSGDPMLLPTPERADTPAAASEAGDLHDLAAVVHYAITREYPPAAPLLGRLPTPSTPSAPAGDPGADSYSESFVAAVDRCLAPDPQQRPQTIEQLRNLLGIVPLGPAVPVQAATGQSAASPVAEPPPAFLNDLATAAEPGRMQRWLMLGAAATVLMVALGALLALLHQTDSRDALTLSLPNAASERQAEAAGADPLAPVIAAAQAPDAGRPAAPASDVSAPAQAPADAAAAAVADGGAAAAPAAQARQLPAAAGASYKLVIKPWAMIEVDGVDRGASPPLKRLTLAPGEHTIRIVNPNFPEHTVTVNAVKGASSVIELNFAEEEEDSP